MKLDDRTTKSLTDQLKIIGIDEGFYAYNYYLSYSYTLITRFSNHFAIPDYLSCFQDIQCEHIPSVQHPLHGRLRENALAAFLLSNEQEITPVESAIKLLAINSVLSLDINYDNQEFHLLRIYLAKNKIHYKEKVAQTSYPDCFDFLKSHLDELIDSQEVKSFIERLLDIYFSRPFRVNSDGNANIKENRSKRDEQIQRTRRTNTTILTGSESKELAKSLVKSLKGKYAPISSLLIISRLCSVSVDDAYDVLADNFEHIVANGSIKKNLKNPKSVMNKTYYENPHSTIELRLPVPLINYLIDLECLFDNPASTTASTFVKKLSNENIKLKRVNLSLIKSSSIQEFNLENKNPILSYVIFSDQDEGEPLEARYNYIDESDMVAYENHARRCHLELKNVKPMPFIYGCKLKQEVVDAFYKNLHERVSAEGKDLWEQLNSRVINRLHALYLATGARPTIDPFSCWNEISVNNKVLRIVDKQVDSSPFRNQAFCELISDIFKQHSKDLAILASAIYRQNSNRKELAREILSLSEGKSSKQLPLFFLLDENLKLISIRAKDLKVEFNQQIPANFPRKIFAAFISRSLDMNTSQALLGHTYVYIPYLGQKSLDTRKNANDIRDATSQLLQHYGFKPLPDLKYYCSKDLFAIHARSLRSPCIEINELKQIIRSDVRRKDKAISLKNLVIKLSKKYRKEEITDNNIFIEAKINNLDEKDLLKRVQRRVRRVENGYRRPDCYRGGSKLLNNSEKFRSKQKLFFIELLNIDGFNKSSISNYLILSLLINRRITDFKLVDLIIKSVNTNDLDEREIEIDHHGKHKSRFILDTVSYYIAKKIKSSFGDVAYSIENFTRYTKSLVEVKSVKELKEIVNAQNTIQLDSLHADFLSGKIRNVTSAFVLNEENNNEVAKIKATVKRRVKPGNLAKTIRSSSNVDVKVFRRRVENLLNKEVLAESDELISKWALHLIDKGLEFSSVKQYLWLINKIVKDSDLFDFLTVSFLDRQDALINHFRRINAKKNAKFDFDIFNQFYDFITLYYDLFIDMNEISEEVEGIKTSINNVVISESDYFKIIKFISNDKTLTFFFILFYRFGCRTREIAYLLQDELIKDDDLYILSIKKNNYRSLKTDKSRRLTHQLEFLSDIERNLIDKYLAERSLSRSTELLFSFEKVDEIDALIKKANSTLQTALQTQYVSIYSFRHSYCCRVVDAIYSSSSSLTRYINKLSGVHGKYTFLSQNLGHSLITTTFENYDHVSQWYFQKQIDDLVNAQISSLTFEQVSVLTGISNEALRKRYGRNENYISQLAPIKTACKSPLSFNPSMNELLVRDDQFSKLDNKLLNRFFTTYVDDLDVFADIFTLSIVSLQDALQAALKITNETGLDPYNLKQRLGKHQPLKDSSNKQGAINDLIAQEELENDYINISEVLKSANFQHRRIVMPSKQSQQFNASFKNIFKFDGLLSSKPINAFQYKIEFKTKGHVGISTPIILCVLFLLMVNNNIGNQHD